MGNSPTTVYQPDVTPHSNSLPAWGIVLIVLLVLGVIAVGGVLAYYFVYVSPRRDKLKTKETNVEAYEEARARHLLAMLKRQRLNNTKPQMVQPQMVQAPPAMACCWAFQPVEVGIAAPLEPQFLSQVSCTISPGMGPSGVVYVCGAPTAPVMGAPVVPPMVPQYDVQQMVSSDTRLRRAVKSEEFPAGPPPVPPPGFVTVPMVIDSVV